MFGWFRCLWRRHHTPTRHYLGGFRCAACGLAGADLEDMGFGFGSGYVAPLRLVFSRNRRDGFSREEW